MSDNTIAPSQNVCEDQDKFNDAVGTALDTYKEATPWESLSGSQKAAVAIATVLVLVFLVWALMLAMRTDPEHRLFHVALALTFGPLYVLSYYVAKLGPSAASS